MAVRRVGSCDQQVSSEKPDSVREKTITAGSAIIIFQMWDVSGPGARRYYNMVQCPACGREILEGELIPVETTFVEMIDEMLFGERTVMCPYCGMEFTVEEEQVDG